MSLRRIVLKAEPHIQASHFDGKRTDVKNFGLTQVEEALLGWLDGSTSVSLSTNQRDYSVQVTKKGRYLLHEHPRKTEATATPTHDRQPDRAFVEGNPDPVLQAVGLMTADGRVKAEMRRKFAQVNQFIRVVLETGELQNLGTVHPRIIDFGCGHAYLSFALHAFLIRQFGLQPELIGVDQNPDLIRRNEAVATELNESSVRFYASPIGDFNRAEQAEIVIALHACDTATDDALAKAVAWNAKLIFAAPCCHHYVQSQPNFSQNADAAHALLLQDGILRERLGDLLTDAMRAQLLRIAGYQVSVIEFASPEHTGKNLMIRAIKRAEIDEKAVAAYLRLREAFRATPKLELLLSEPFRHLLAPDPR